MSEKTKWCCCFVAGIEQIIDFSFYFLSVSLIFVKQFSVSRRNNFFIRLLFSIIIIKKSFVKCLSLNRNLRALIIANEYPI